MKTYHILFQPAQIDLHLVLQDGKVLGHLPNYTRIHRDPPANTDGAVQRLSFRAADDVVHTVKDNGIEVTYLWAGDRSTRSNPQDLVRVEIAHVGAQASVTSSPALLAKEAFTGLPDAVKLAAVIVHTPEEVLNSIRLEDRQATLLTAWADQTLADFTAQKV